MADLRELIDTFAAAQAAYEAADPEEDDSPEWSAYDAAQRAVIMFPCRTLDEVRAKARFFMENDGPYDTIRNCRTDTEETLMPFLRSLLGEVQP